MSAADWGAVGGQAAEEAWHLLGLAGPALFGGWLLFLAVRALLRSDRYRVERTLTEEDRRAVREALREAERKTVGEILPVVVERSDPHPGADWLAALSFLLAGSTLLAVWLPWSHPALLLVAQLALGSLGFVLARALPDLKRVFVFEDRATSVAEEQAFQEFHRHGLHRTVGATGVLLFVSLLERRVVVLADDGIASRVEPSFWEGVDDAVLEAVRRGALRDGLVAGIRRVGELLSREFPWTAGDRNEIPDRVIVRKE